MNLKYYLRGLGIGIAMTTVILGLGTDKQAKTMTDAQIKQRAAELGMVETGGVLAEREEEQVTEETQEAASSEKEEESKVTKTPEKTQAPKETEIPKETEKPKASEEPEEAKVPEETGTPEETETKETGAVPEKTENLKDTETPKATTPPEETEDPEKNKAVEESDISGETEKTEETQNGQEKAEAAFTIEVRSGDGSHTICKKLEEAGMIASASAFDSFLCQNGYDKKLQVGVYEIPAGAQPEEIARILTKGK